MKEKRSTNRHFFTLLMLIGIAGCHNNSPQTKSDTTKSAEKVIVEKPVATLHCESKIIDQELSFDALAFEVFKADTNKINTLFRDPVIIKMERDTSREKSDEGVPYYLHTFTDGINRISLMFHPGEGFYIEDADIKNDGVHLNKKISIGMNEDAFVKLVKAKSIKCDTVTVANDELTFESVYIFKGAKLKEILMGQTVE